MHVIDWLFVLVPLLCVLIVGVKAQKHVHGVVDFLSAGRIAGRYVLSVSTGMASMGLITLVAMAEMYYHSGFPIVFWLIATMPFIFFISMTGFCTYRFRETRALTMGQFFEIRYNKAFRLTAAVMQSTAGIINYAIFPAVGARFLVYYINLPQEFQLLGMTMSTTMVVMALFLSLALLVSTMGGQVTVMVTDCLQGIFSYPMFLAIICYFLYRFSWDGEIIPALTARPPEQSLLNPFDSSSLKDFNLFYVFAGIVGMFIGHMTWGGTQGYNGAARTPHESKMGNLLGRWRTAFGDYMYVLLAIVAFAFMNHAHFAKESHDVRTSLADKVLHETVSDAQFREEITAAYATIQPRQAFSPSFDSTEAYQAEVKDPFVQATEAVLESQTAPVGSRKEAQTFRSVYTQMTVPMALREILPTGLVGVFCALMIFLLISTDTTYMHAWGSILIQDLVVPLCKKPLTPEVQIRALRWAIAGVAVFAFIFSNSFAQFDFIIMFFSVTGALWAGAGAVITLGLYWSRSTTAGAFASLISGVAIALSGFLLQQNWVERVYPWIVESQWLIPVTGMMDTVTSWFGPYIVWEMSSQKCPINSQEILFITNIVSLSLFIIVSLLTSKKPFNMDCMLHRGEWAIADDATTLYDSSKRKTWRTTFQNCILGIDEAYSRGDRVIAWSAFIWSFIYVFGATFVGVIIWNKISPWPVEWWSRYFFITIFLGALVLGVIFTVWFSICGIRELRRLFIDLASRATIDESDNGQVQRNK